MALTAGVLAAYLLWPVWERDTFDVGAIETVRTTEVTSERGAKGKATSERSTEQETRSQDGGALAAVFDEAGVLVLARIALIAMSAFIAGFATQRILLADFAIKAGGVEIPPIAGDAVERSLEMALGVIDTLDTTEIADTGD